MSFVSALLALLLPGTANPGQAGPGEEIASATAIAAVEAPNAQQVRIEQRITIRIAPRRAPVPPEQALAANRARAPHVTERRMGKCVPVSAIGGVQVSSDDRLLLFLRDNRLVSASLERSCRARDFYSGFYLERHADGKLCVDRDMLLARSGANCKLTHLRQLVTDGD
jgi:hypothetical protein